ncbi:glycerol dehydrogenase [Thorsellia anophelis]|uniref:Glycerol dehydrogenase n=1 Tax=Thorsellia anophelis DSM 18579 TaxID=1123402 RepID=A0A1I0DJW4_9GAMM|nr:glycerol dehydrogenase [Thorsellia anophelis]SET32762.1 glycerol dehydrogenase [Thorsellia anophelis DSM 18579]
MRRAFISPSKYVQGENELLNLGYFISAYGKSALLISHPDDVARVRESLDKTIEQFSVKVIEGAFEGECTQAEIDRLSQLAKESQCACIVGLGGGKALDTAKSVAKGQPLIIIPTIASTDAPTSHSSVIYTKEGNFESYAYHASPSLVLIDTTVIAKAPVRFLVAGMGDSLSTYFEARASSSAFANVNAGLPMGFREGKAPPAKATKTALGLAELCYETLLEEGYKAKVACELNTVTPALENIIETNILLSGLGFESGGLAAAHAIHNGLTVLEGTHKFYHGEKVAFGTIVQLVLENAPLDELDEVIDFCLLVGLPVCLEDIGVTQYTQNELYEVAKKACLPEESIHSMPFPVTPESVVAAILSADKIGRDAKGI